MSECRTGKAVFPLCYRRDVAAAMMAPARLRLASEIEMRCLQRLESDPEGKGWRKGGVKGGNQSFVFVVVVVIG